MRQRCLNSKAANYKYYGGKGIKVCERWLNFDNFYADMGERPAYYVLDRLDNTKDYCKENCKWSPQEHNARNRQGTRLTAEKVINIRRRLKEGEYVSDLAEEYQMSGAQISCIKHNRTWKNI